MHLIDIQRTFNRALLLTFSKKKLILTSIILAFCGLLMIFFQGLSMHAGYWITLSLIFIPLFLCSGLLLSAGILLIRIYHDEVKKKEVRYRDVMARSWEVIIGASYFSIPVILSYLLLWMTLGIFIMLKEIPAVGSFFMATLSFAPFLLNLGSILLCFFALLVLFFITPLVALKGINRMQLAQDLTKRLKGDIFSNIVLGVIALIPLIFSMTLLCLAAFLTASMCDACDNPLYAMVHSFFVMVPFAVMLSPSVIFFFNFAAEAHVLMKQHSQRL